jgi:hypothetical protein
LKLQSYVAHPVSMHTVASRDKSLANRTIDTHDAQTKGH